MFEAPKGKRSEFAVFKLISARGHIPPKPKDLHKLNTNVITNLPHVYVPSAEFDGISEVYQMFGDEFGRTIGGKDNLPGLKAGDWIVSQTKNLMGLSDSQQLNSEVFGLIAPSSIYNEMQPHCFMVGYQEGWNNAIYMIEQ